MLTAYDLLHQFLDLQGLTPDLDNWTEKYLIDNEPRLIRLRQLMALFRAFGIPWNPESFVTGKFFNPEDDRYQATLQKLTAETGDNHVRSYHLSWYFKILFSYRKQLQEVLSTTSGVLESSGLFALAIAKSEEVNEIIRSNIPRIEDRLVPFISPEQASFSLEHLVKDFGYPDVNLWEIDAEWA
jgi:hypothetical protein